MLYAVSIVLLIFCLCHWQWRYRMNRRYYTERAVVGKGDRRDGGHTAADVVKTTRVKFIPLPGLLVFPSAFVS
jgi:hypothetical protein